MALNSTRRFELRARPDFRKAVAFGLLALARADRRPRGRRRAATNARTRLIGDGCAALVAVFGLGASRAAARKVHRIAVARVGEVAATRCGGWSCSSGT